MLKIPLDSRVYISGPMSSMPGENEEAFLEAEVRLTDAGYQPINPHFLSAKLRDSNRKHELPPPTYHQFLRVDMEALIRCDAIYMLKGFQQSPGAMKELRWATDLAIPIFFEDEA